MLHYNVGVSIAGGDAPLAEITEAAFDRIATINLRGAIMACKHVLPVMRAQRSGVIITISSVGAWEQYPNVAYKATKAAMIAFTQQIAIQNAEFGVRANVILPGTMDTPANRRAMPKADFKKWVKPETVARLMVWLAGDGTNDVNGAVIPVYGNEL